jgi:predicted short-subunit dehydrogenase-like oxidoreductase (DUF2520 family)
MANARRLYLKANDAAQNSTDPVAKGAAEILSGQSHGLAGPISRPDAHPAAVQEREQVLKEVWAALAIDKVVFLRLLYWHRAAILLHM